MRCFADKGDKCAALKVKECEGCNFFKTIEQKAKDDEKTEKRLAYLKNNLQEEEAN